MTDDAAVHDPDWLGFDWSPWLSLSPGDDEVGTLAADPGLYRVRHDAYDGLVFVGGTGRSLLGRVRALVREAYGDEMPYKDPHTAAPALWAIRDRHGPGLEVSGVTPPEATDARERRAIEDALIGIHRRETGTNLVANFGRMPPGYTKSGRRGSRVRGGPSDDADRDFRAGIDPLPWTNVDGVTDRDWLGLSWSRPLELAAEGADVPDAAGLYRLRDPESSPPLEYVGETISLADRFRAYRRNHDDHLTFSWVTRPDAAERFQLSQAAGSLRGAHWLACGVPPRDQY